MNSNGSVEIVSTTKTRKRLHSIATKTEVSLLLPSSPSDTDCASPTRQARLLNPRLYSCFCIYQRSFILINLELSAAKATLHSHVSSQICGREEERRLIQQFCSQKLSDKTRTISNPCMYIYGAPGTG